MARLHEAKQKHLKEMVLMGEVPLRTGACSCGLCPSNEHCLAFNTFLSIHIGAPERFQLNRGMRLHQLCSPRVSLVGA